MGATDIKIRIGADDSALQKQLKRTEMALQRSGNKLMALGKSMTMALTVPILGLAAGAVKSAVDIDVLKKSLTGIMGSARLAAVEFEKLRILSKDPGLDLKSAINGSVRLQAIGYSAEKAASQLKILANGVALVGGSGEDLAGVTLAITQILSKGKVHAEEINQMAERMPQVRKAMMDAFGTADTEILQKAKITATDFVDGIVEQLARLPKAQLSFRDQMNHVRDDISIFAADVGERLVPLLITLGEWIVSLGKKWKSLSDLQQISILAFVALIALMPVLTYGFGVLLKSIVIFSTATLGALKFIGAGFMAIYAAIGLWVIPLTIVVGVILYLLSDVDKLSTVIAWVANGFIDAYNNSITFRAAIQGIVVAFKIVWETVKLFFKGVVNGWTLLADLFKNGFNFKNIPSILDDSEQAGVKLWKEYGSNVAAAINEGLKNTLEPIPLKNVSETAVADWIREQKAKLALLLMGFDPKLQLGSLEPGKKGTNPLAPDPIPREIGQIKGVDAIPKGKSNAILIKSATKDIQMLMVATENANSSITTLFKKDQEGMEFGDIIDVLIDKTINFGKMSAEVVATIAAGIGSMVNQLGNTLSKFYDNKLQRLENVYDRERKLIEKSGLSEEQKNKRIQKLDEETARKKRKAARDQAKIDKATAIFQATIFGIVEVAKVASNLPLAIAVGVLAAANIAAIASEPLPALAKGGIVSGDTAVRVGEYQGASFGNPEVISPLNKLKDMIKGSMGNVHVALSGGWRVNGLELETMLEGARVQRNRLTA